jgi:hypothetical protein
MGNNKLLISGNSYLDVIVTDKEERQSGLNSRGDINFTLGGIFNISNDLSKIGVAHQVKAILGHPINSNNIWKFLPNKVLVSMEPQYDLTFSAADMCYAIINERTYQSSRSSIVKNGVSRELDLNLEVDFSHHHISYIDNLPNYSTQMLENNVLSGQFISVDLCLNDPTEEEKIETLKKITKVSLTIMSESEFFGLFGLSSSLEVIKNLPLKLDNIIVHKEDGIIIKEGSRVEVLNCNRRGNISVLGLGDKFVSYFYASYLANSDILTSAKSAFWEIQNEVWSE